MKRLCLVILCVALASCTDEPILYNQLKYGDMTGDIWTGHKSNPIRLQCGRGCKTITNNPICGKPALSKQQKATIRAFLNQQNRNKTVYIAPCDGIPLPCEKNRKLVSLVANEIYSYGYKVWVAQPVFPLPPHSPRPECVILLRGNLTTIVPECPNLNILDSVYHIPSNFGCANAQSLASMVSDPWDLIQAPDEEGPNPSARVINGNKKYNEGKTIRFQSSTSTVSIAPPTIQDF